jgi:predicted dehydrogenase
LSVGVGILGAGWIAAAHIDGVRRLPGTRVVAISATSIERARARAIEMDISKAYVGWNDLLDDPDVEVVHNATPTPLHFESNRAIIAAGKHVISDKPLTVTAAEAGSLLDAARAAGVVHAVTFNHRGFRAVHQMRTLIASGQIGHVQAIRGAYLQGWLNEPSAGNWRVASTRVSGTLLDIGSHWLDLCEWVTGQRVSAVMADLQQLVPSRGGAEACSALLRFVSGVRGATTISQTATGRGNQLSLEVYGSNGGLVWNSESPDQLLRLDAAGMSESVLYGAPEALALRPFGVSPARHPEAWLDAWRNLLAPIYAAISGNPSAEYPTFEAGLRVAALLEAIQRSHQQERWITPESTR